MQSLVRRLLVVIPIAAVAVGAGAQQPAPPPQPVGPAVGQPAPTFTLSGATRSGLLRDSIRLSDFRGQTVVIAFFPKARTKG